MTDSVCRTAKEHIELTLGLSGHRARRSWANAAQVSSFETQFSMFEKRESSTDRGIWESPTVYLWRKHVDGTDERSELTAGSKMKWKQISVSSLWDWDCCSDYLRKEKSASHNWDGKSSQEFQGLKQRMYLRSKIRKDSMHVKATARFKAFNEFWGR